MKMIEVSEPIGSERRFPTIEDAVAYRAEREPGSAARSAAVVGHRISAGKWTDSELILSLEGGLSLKIFLVGPVVDWSVLNADEKKLSEPDLAREDLLLLRFRDEDSPWNRPLLLRSRIGKRIVRLFVNDCWLFLYVEDAPILLFLALGRRDGGEPLLHWDETD